MQGAIPLVELVVVLNHVLHSAIAPVLILLEIGHETGTRDFGEPAGGHTLHRPTEQQGRQVHTQCGADQSHSAFDHPQPRKGPTHRDGQLLGPAPG